MKKRSDCFKSISVLSLMVLSTIALAACGNSSSGEETSSTTNVDPVSSEVISSEMPLLDYNFEAEDAVLTPSNPEAVGNNLIHVDTAAVGASGEKAVGWVQKNDSVTWGIHTDKAGDYAGVLVISHPMKWVSVTLSPVSFRLDDIYSFIVNGIEVEVDGYHEFTDDPQTNHYNYYYWVDIIVELPLVAGDNVITLKKTARNNDYASTGNIDTLIVTSNTVLNYFEAEPAAEPELTFDLNLSKPSYVEEEAIMVSGKNRNDHVEDVVALFKATDVLGEEGVEPLYLYYPHLAGIDEVNLLNYPNVGVRDDERPLVPGNYTVYLLGDGKIEYASMLMLLDVTITAKPQEPSETVFLRTDKVSFVQGEAIMVTAQVEVEKDWVAIYKKSDANLGSCGGSLYYYYPMVKGNGSAVDITTTIMNVERPEADLRPGDYRIYLLANDGYTPRFSIDITIVAAPEVAHPHLSLATRIFAFKATDTRSIIVNVTPREGHPKDWVALMKLEDDITGPKHGGGSLFYFYPAEDGNEVDITTKNPHSQRLEDIKLAPGKYQLHYLADDGYEVLDTLVFTIAEK